jgi:hypothetical protein
VTSPQDHVDGRVRAYYGAELDESDRLVGRSGQGVVEFERTQRFVRDRVTAGSRVIDIGGAAGIHARALGERGDPVLLVADDESLAHDPRELETVRVLAEADESQPGLRDPSPHLLARGRA